MYVCPQLLNMLINLNMLCVNLQSRAEVNGANVSRKIIGELSEGSHNVHYGSDNIETNFGGSKTVVC